MNAGFLNRRPQVRILPRALRTVAYVVQHVARLMECQQVGVRNVDPPSGAAFKQTREVRERDDIIATFDSGPEEVLVEPR